MRFPIELPGTRIFELPPLLIGSAEVPECVGLLEAAMETVEQEDLIAENSTATYQQKMDLALNLKEAYCKIISHWRYGNAVIEWVPQCELEFKTREELRHLLQSDVWPHAGRNTFIELLQSKEVLPQGVDLQKALGLRLTFRQTPPLPCFTNDFLFYLNASTKSAYTTWSGLAPDPLPVFPPDRFSFQVLEIA